MAGGGEDWEHGPDDEGNGEDGSDRDEDEDVAQARFFTGDTDEDAGDLQCQGMSQSGSLASSSSKFWWDSRTGYNTYHVIVSDDIEMTSTRTPQVALEKRRGNGWFMIGDRRLEREVGERNLGIGRRMWM
ncbi:hypothetical protein BT96DRAFT_947430 [Gymnopus androsaceus JB14]|uniref:Uncharacterized protein n=1 Tax=Gymnopus androsaceus JB14 TaxID=1447944 RepID=A0A6A4GSA5_9AGAR|nr:hypothetical protein BT96DRAFT_947430 [Gymnopus androsaceus JB14]